MIHSDIQKIDFFTLLSDDKIDIISKMSNIENYGKDNILYYEKTVSKKLYFLIDGLAKSYKIDKFENECFLYYIQPNEILSEITTFSNNINDTDNNTILKSTYSNIIFLEDSKVLSIDYKSFHKVMLETDILTHSLANEVSKRNDKLELLINREFIYDAVSKVAMMLENDLDIFNKLKKQEIALILHIQPSTLSRAINRLKRDEIIEIKNNTIYILNTDKLKNVYI